MTDQRVEAAITHWAGRFIANGIDYNDFARTTRSDHVLGAVARRVVGNRRGPHGAGRARRWERGRHRSAGEAYLQAAVSYHFSKFVWVLDAERNRQNTEAAVRAMYAAHQLLDPSAERIEAPLGRLPCGGQPAPPAADPAPRRWSC